MFKRTVFLLAISLVSVFSLCAMEGDDYVHNKAQRLCELLRVYRMGVAGKDSENTIIGNRRILLNVTRETFTEVLRGFIQENNLSAGLPSDFNAAQFLKHCVIFEENVFLWENASDLQKILMYLNLYLRDEYKIFLYIKYRFNHDVDDLLSGDLNERDNVWEEFWKSLYSDKAVLLFKVCEFYEQVLRAVYEDEDFEAIPCGIASLESCFSSILFDFIKEKQLELPQNFKPALFLKYFSFVRSGKFNFQNNLTFMEPLSVNFERFSQEPKKQDEAIVFHIRCFMSDENHIFGVIKSFFDIDRVELLIGELHHGANEIWQTIFQEVDTDACFEHLNNLTPRNFFLVWYDEPTLYNTILRFHRPRNLFEQEELVEEENNEIIDENNNDFENGWTINMDERTFQRFLQIHQSNLDESSESDN